jgi:hypothetical protein
MLAQIRDPLPGVLVRMRSALVALPWPTSPPDFYTKLRAHFAEGEAVFSGTEYFWPTRLEMVLDLVYTPPPGTPTGE